MFTTRTKANHGRSQKIYFDGYLPPSKLDVRLERLRGMTRRLNGYYHANPVPCRVPYLSQEPKYENLPDRGPMRSTSTTLPPAPFIVPIVIDALGNSEAYKDLVEVVPGEADLYCGRYLKQHGGLVLTGDSDLLIHDLGPDGSVSFFKDIELLPDMHSPIYYPATIADRLALPQPHGLRGLAFEMTVDRQSTFRKLLGEAIALKAVNAHGDQYVEFLREYISLPANTEHSLNNGSQCPARLMTILRKLDPRISEFVLQFSSIAGDTDNAGLAITPETGSIHVFLPFLVDCPIRTTSWETSTSLRQLAYGLLKDTVAKSDQELSVVEHRRQNDMNGKGYRLSNVPVIHEFCSSLINLIDKAHRKYPTLSIYDRWIAFAVCQEVAWSSSAGKPILCSLVAQELSPLRQERDNRIPCTWDTVQFLAQVQGVFYSLRILQQVTSLLVSYRHASPSLDGVSILHDQLKSLPPLSNLPSLASVVSLVHKIESEHMVQAAHDILGIKAQKSTEVHGTSKKSKKKGKVDKHIPSMSPGNMQINNSFQLLDVE